ncbi:MAG: hypothetical protein ACKVRO_04385 [Micropepsaceae bacterium]
MEFDAAEYRHRAAGARLRASQMPDERGKGVMRRIAEDYERMAQERDAAARKRKLERAQRSNAEDPNAEL